MFVDLFLRGERIKENEAELRRVAVEHAAHVEGEAQRAEEQRRADERAAAEPAASTGTPTGEGKATKPKKQAVMERPATDPDANALRVGGPAEPD